ncbi:MAG: serine dehydratase subunit alpha family protein [Clostridia bacterium]|nr:serine dehydratase subunit alpha family protein [Clostridia bacterium]
MNELSKKLIDAVKNDLTPSLGVTEPCAIAYASACAARALGGRVTAVKARLNSCIYKNSFTCAVPGTDGMGCALAAALGAVCGDPEKKLTCLDGVTKTDAAEAEKLVSEGNAAAELYSISPDVFIEARVATECGEAVAVIKGKHDRLTSLRVNGIEQMSPCDTKADGEPFMVSSVTFADLIECAETAEGLEFLDEAVKMDIALFEEGKRRGLIPLTLSRYAPGEPNAELLTCGAIEARVRGAKAPAMAITGSGSHGILCIMPVYASSVCDETKADPDRTRRAMLLSCLVTMYIKELSGLLSTACGCVLAGGTGAALGLTYLYAEDRLYERLSFALNSMAASVTGMICHGGNTGCSIKALIGVRMAEAACEMALEGVGAESVHGILGLTPEETMRNMGRIARGMLPVEKDILDIMSCKAESRLL